MQNLKQFDDSVHDIVPFVFSSNPVAHVSSWLDLVGIQTQ